VGEPGRYHQVWWPLCDWPVYIIPVWDADRQCYVDPETGEPLPTWVKGATSGKGCDLR
jgi:hypothetical protein